MKKPAHSGKLIKKADKKAWQNFQKKVTIAFQCQICGEKIAIGKCGEHRQKTHHADFQPIYKNHAENNVQQVKGGCYNEKS